MEFQLNDIDILIGKVLANECTEEESKRLQQWCEARPENRLYFNQSRTIFDNASSSNVQLNFDSDAAWQKVKEKLQPTGGRKSVSINRVLTPVRMAAGIAIILSIGYFAYQWSEVKSQTFAVVTDALTIQDTLPDGSKAFLNKNSSLLFEYNPRQKTRKVKLKGESYFEIAHQPDKSFIIEAEEVLIRDIGTSFNIRAWPEEDTLEVSVSTGEVRLYSASDPGISIGAGEAGIYSKRLHRFSKLERADTNVLAYKTKVFSFDRTPLIAMLEKINKVYGSSIKLGNPELENCQMTVNFNGESLETIVDIIAETLKLSMTKKDNEILLNGTGCK